MSIHVDKVFNRATKSGEMLIRYRYVRLPDSDELPHSWCLSPCCGGVSADHPAPFPQMPNEPLFSFHAHSQRFFISKASVALDAFNGTEQGFHGNLDNMSPLCASVWPIAPSIMRSKGLEYATSHAAFSFVTPQLAVHAVPWGKAAICSKG